MSTTHFSLTSEAYHADPSLGSSGIRELLRSPYHFWAAYRAPGRPASEPSAAMRLGTMVHALILEPEPFRSRFVMRPDGLDMRTAEGKAWRAEQTAEIVSQEEWRAAFEAEAALRRDLPDLADLIADGRPEVSVFWEDDDVACKARPDLIAKSGRILIDIKTSRDASPDAFRAAVARYGYHRQAAWYSRGWEQASGMRADQFLFVVLTTTYPFLAAAYTLDAQALQQGADECNAAMLLLRECEESGRWPAYGSQPIELSLPPWAQASNDVEVSYVE